MFKIMVIDDDKHINRLFCAILRSEGYDVESACDGYDALDKMNSFPADLIILDVMMPNMDGYELTRLLRNNHNTLPILMITAKVQPQDKHRGFLVGTDDYMTKPVDKTEMLYRVKALLRRSRIVNERQIIIGDVTLNYDTLTVTRKEQKQVLPPKEFYLLYKLLAYPEQIFTKIQLLDEIWGLESASMESTVTVHINRLRKRLAGYPEFELVSVRGLGYKAVKKV